ncbi:MAG TPA: LON peptidase substrate-binding domain-containing protein [Acetobacteraceae bacterium]|jgi:Lon protease-like protein|nr:LON peptidase substrate-binding domain-containing protein [Acetobacteraceae bacterium]
MAAFHPRVEDLPDEFPVFPLPGVLLLPRGKLPLRIFEPRYKAMTEDALGQGRMFAMIQPDPTVPEGDRGPGLYRIGCLGRVSSFSETDEEHYLITLTGLVRFAISRELDMRRGYRRVSGDFSAYHNDLDLAAQPIAVEREALLTALRGYFTQRRFEANWDAIKRLDDDSLVVTLAMVCPFEPAEKQALLEAPGQAERAAALLVLLQMGALAPNSPGGHSVS